MSTRSRQSASGRTLSGRLAVVPGAALLALGLGCALMSKGEALSPRYFSPRLELASAERARERAADAAAPPELRLGRVEPAAHVEQRIARRVSDTELVYDDARRWTEPPEEFVRRALARELFERRGFQRVVSGAAPTLDVEVIGFEELGREPRRARLLLALTLHDDRRALFERTLEVEAPLEPGDEGTALAAAMGDALARATRQIAEYVESALGSTGS